MTAKRIVDRVSGDHPLVLELSGLLGELVGLYEQIKTMGERRLDAIRSADARGLAACVRGENELVQRVAEAEKTRLRVVGGLSEALGAPGAGETTMGWLAQRVDGPRSDELGGLAATLRRLMGEVMQLNTVARRATETLSRHMEGLMREVKRTMNHAQVYGRGGTMDTGARVMSGLDIRS